MQLNSYNFIKKRMNNTFIVNEKGQLDFKGEIFRIMPEYKILPNDKKVDMLIMLINWANDEIKKANS